MKVLYVASGIPVPGTLGGSTHTLEVARGLAERGHAVHVVAAARSGWSGIAPLFRPISSTYAGFHLHHLDVPKSAALLCAPLIARLARAVRPDVIVERYGSPRVAIINYRRYQALVAAEKELIRLRLQQASAAASARAADLDVFELDNLIQEARTEASNARKQ